jgi:hypothetical protein
MKTLLFNDTEVLLWKWCSGQDINTCLFQMLLICYLQYSLTSMFRVQGLYVLLASSFQPMC